MKRKTCEEIDEDFDNIDVKTVPQNHLWMEEWTRAQELIIELTKSTRLENKVDILKRYDDCVYILLYVYNPFWNYNITSTRLRNVEKKMDTDLLSDSCTSIFGNYENVYQLLDDLRQRNISGNDAVMSILRFCHRYSQFRDLFFRVIDRNLGIRCGRSTIDEAFPGLIPQFKTSSGRDIQDIIPKSLNFSKTQWYVSQRIRGLRVLCFVVSEQCVEFKTKDGKTISSLHVLEEAVKKLKIPPGIVFDGKLAVAENTDQESFDFEEAENLVRKKQGFIENPIYVVFDAMSIDEFTIGYSSVLFSNRLSALRDLIPISNEHIRMVKHFKIKDEEHIHRLNEEAISLNWDGLVLRQDGPYEAKKTNKIIHWEQFREETFIVDDYRNIAVRIVDPRYCTQNEKMILKYITIRWGENNSCQVSSGFTLEERELYSDGSLIGKNAVITYLSKKTLTDGKEILYCPVFKTLL